MVDYDKATGTAGTLRIRDTGGNVELWIYCSDGQTFCTANTYFVINGTSHNTSNNLPKGFGQKLIWSEYVGSSGGVQFDLGATGTSGLGGYTQHSAYISRAPAATVPPAPTMLQPDPAFITATGMRVQFSSNGDGGNTLTAWHLQRALDAGFTTGVQTINSSGTTYYTDMAPATPYWFRARGVNGLGEGPWSSIVTASTLASIFVSDGSSWIPAPLTVSDGDSFEQAEVYVSDGTTWRLAG